MEQKALWLQQSDLVDVFLGNPVRVAQPEDRVEFRDVEPVEGQVEAHDRVLANPLNECQRFGDWPPPDLVQDDGAVLLGVLQQHHHAVQPAGFGVDIDFRWKIRHYAPRRAAHREQNAYAA